MAKLTKQQRKQRNYARSYGVNDLSGRLRCLWASKSSTNDGRRSYDKNNNGDIRELQKQTTQGNDTLKGSAVLQHKALK